MAYENLKLGVSPITNTVFAGRVNKKGDMWIDKVDITKQFLACVVDYFSKEGITVIRANGEPILEITVTDLRGVQ
jgi:hypothetical protein